MRHHFYLHRDLITLLLLLERWEDAAQELEQLLLLEPMDQAAWLGLSDCYLRLGQPRTAARVLEAALLRMPMDPRVNERLASAYELWMVDRARGGDWAAAREGLRRLQARYPSDPRTIRLQAALASP